MLASLRGYRGIHSAFATLARRQKHTLPSLKYDYGALEPAISGVIMETHHSKHHQTYVNGLNQAEADYKEAQAADDIKKQIALQAALKFNGGGHLNHSLFWENLSPAKDQGGQFSSGQFAKLVEQEFGSLENMQSAVTKAALGIQGSGWVWLGYNTALKRLEIVTTANQDPLVSSVPLFGIDMWEHGFYLQYKQDKASYLKNIWSVINYAKAEERLAEALN